MTGPSSLYVFPVYDLAARLLECIEDAYATEVERGDASRVTALPARRYVAGGGPRDLAWDCDEGQVTVALDRLIRGTNPQAAPRVARSPGHAASHAALITGAVFEVQIVRPAPGLSESTGAIPSRDRIGLHGREFLRDAGFLAGLLSSAVPGGALAEVTTPEGVTPLPVPVQIGDMVSLGPQGYLAATATGVTVTAT